MKSRDFVSIAFVVLAVLLTGYGVLVSAPHVPPVALPPPAVPVAPRYPATLHRVLDGDTVEVTIHLPWRVSIGPETVRALDYDAWEVSKRRGSVKVTDAEVAKGKIAVTALAELLARAELYVEPDGAGERDNYGRPLCRLYAKTKDGAWVELAAWARQNKHTRN